MAKYVCTICGFVYDEDEGLPGDGLAPGTKWEDVPEDWCCPDCGAPKSAFELQERSPPPSNPLSLESVYRNGDRTILYFSATGNSKHVANKISLETGDSLVSMAKCCLNGAFSFELGEGESLGIVSPTYYSGLPSVVEDFLRQMQIRSVDEGPYVYCVATYGRSSGCSSLYEDVYLSDKGFPAAARFTVRMVDNFLPDHDVNDKDAIAKINAAADKEIEGIIRKILAQAHGDFSDSKRPMFLAKRDHKRYEKARTTDHLSSDEGKCIGCRRCEKFCPVQAIKVKGKHVEWVKDQCAMCFGCLNRCPANAIEYDHATGGKGQYVHPGVKLSMTV